MWASGNGRTLAGRRFESRPDHGRPSMSGPRSRQLDNRKRERPTFPAPRFEAMLAPLLLATVTQLAPATVDMNEDEFRLYCGYLDVISGNPDIAKLPDTKRNKKIADMAKVKPAALTSAVTKGTTFGATCDEVGKKAEADTKAALDAAMPKRISVFKL